MANEKIRILIVDDEPDILEVIEYNLLKEDYQVIKAFNGREALEKARVEKPNLILLDIMMPEMDGIEVCRELRSNHAFDNTLIAFLTARNEDFTQVQGFDVGADDYITKPIKPRLLVSRIKALLRRTGSADQNHEQVSYGDISIDEEKYLVYVKGKPISLAKKEFELIQLLVSRPGKVFTRQEIFNKIWGMDVIVGDRTIDVHIRKIREKVGEDYIKTIKGIGYKFDQ
ncbi:MAG TPA: response regulator transcription factor [Chitinophagales bacterium]|nr:response regulator transcription factor [Chitinophagales bacterium]HMU68519.1 response regulator transcription factor [Chitinophagales bacterium]HMX04554.1 response regulator transcription factor [Chitinophagales bacterium]HMZ89082.1 response regulator transcription factor [Chitinophagales bacterium]HNA57706.1 response regulator transcription factor [Chitinophagales bacterium]